MVICTIKYSGFFKNGKEFDSTYCKKHFTFQLGVSPIINSLHEGIRGMKIGGVREVIIPSNLAYGKKEWELFLLIQFYYIK